jgi:hypothetical protein
VRGGHNMNKVTFSRKHCYRSTILSKKKDLVAEEEEEKKSFISFL